MSYWTGDAMEVGTVEQLLIDDHIVEDAWDLERRVCRPLRHPIGPVLHADQPWESGVRYCHVFYDERDGIYRMLYGAVNIHAYQYQYRAELQGRWSMAEHGPAKFVCYAESRDGLHWDKPLFDFAPWRDHKRSNIVMTGRTRAQAAHVFRNLDESDDDRRYIMMYRDIYNFMKPNPRDGRCFAYSPDCIHWTEDEANPVTKGGTDAMTPLVWDPASAQWFCFCRPRMWCFDRDVSGDFARGGLKRRMAVMTSPDLRQWSFMRTVIYPDELDPDMMSVEGASVAFKCGSHFIAFLGITDDRRNTTDSQIASSADGFHWSRLPQRPVYFERGPEGSWERDVAGPCCPPVEHGENWLFYYMGMTRESIDNSVSAIGVAVVPRGRLVGRFAGDRHGFLLTRELIIGAKHLDINCERVLAMNENLDSPHNEIRVGIARRAPGVSDHRDLGYYDGFAAVDCDRITSSNTAHRVTWKGNDDLSSLVGKPAYLRFYLRNAGVYSFRFLND